MLAYKEKGKHCAFTDLAYYNGVYYLCFRVGKEHMFSKSKIVVLCSKDGAGWKERVASPEKEDLRDPRFYLDYDNRLKVLVNQQKIETVGFLRKRKRVVKQASVKWDFELGNYSRYPNKFITFVKDHTFFAYDAVRGNGTFLIKDYPEEFEIIELPAFSDSTEGAFYNEDECLVRRDGHCSYLLHKNRIFQYKQRLHCIYPFVFKGLRYFLARKTSRNYKRAVLGLFSFTDPPKCLKRFKAFGDCGYFGYANGLVSYHSSYDKNKPQKTAIFIEDIKDFLEKDVENGSAQ